MQTMNQSFQYHEKQGVIVIWQAKAACTVVNKMYYKEEGLLEKALKHSKWIHHYRQKHNHETAAKRNKGLANPHTKYIQFVVNPYRRAVSSYIHNGIHNYGGLTDVKELSFSQFCDKILTNKIRNDWHHNRQIYQHYQQKKIEYIKMEEIDEQLPIINKKYGLNYTLETSSHHAKTQHVVGEFMGNVAWKKIKQIPTDYSLFYNDEIRQKVEKIYGADIKEFKYTWDEFIR